MVFMASPAAMPYSAARQQLFTALWHVVSCLTHGVHPRRTPLPQFPENREFNREIQKIGRICDSRTSGTSRSRRRNGFARNLCQRKGECASPHTACLHPRMLFR